MQKCVLLTSFYFLRVFVNSQARLSLILRLISHFLCLTLANITSMLFFLDKKEPKNQEKTKLPLAFAKLQRSTARSLWLAQRQLSSFAVAKQNQSKDDCYSFQPQIHSHRRPAVFRAYAFSISLFNIIICLKSFNFIVKLLLICNRVEFQEMITKILFVVLINLTYK